MNGHSLIWLVLVSSRVFFTLNVAILAVSGIRTPDFYGRKTLKNESKKMSMETTRIELMTLQTPDLHAVMALSGIHCIHGDERQHLNSLLTVRIAISM